MEYLRLLPGLTDLDIGPVGRPHYLLEVLGTVADLLPNLRILTIRGDIMINNNRAVRAHYAAVLNMLTLRRASLQSFRLITSRSKERAPEDIVIALQQLAQGGMRIRIGPEEENDI
ncbi:hypothetical protein DFH07DRAFT_1058214 [Mycena maculata]|uniref:Uncharacterized protein n=1 Tax=Mycena maculata TaxID=230809 RepID=A0AAD7JPD7_9AGAR|nr:hypothetical protein DFH07DRAFT_1058214 [Mycena maculata]